MTVNTMADCWCSYNRERSKRLYTIALETTRVSLPIHACDKHLPCMNYELSNANKCHIYLNLDRNVECNVLQLFHFSTSEQEVGITEHYNTATIFHC